MARPNLARFVAPNTLCLPRATGSDDPNAAIYADAKGRAEAAGVTVAEIPSPGRVTSGDRIEPASYANFAITSHLVIVPTFDSPHDAEGVAAVAELFPNRATIGLPGDAVLAGGGGSIAPASKCPRPDGGLNLSLAIAAENGGHGQAHRSLPPPPSRWPISRAR